MIKKKDLSSEDKKVWDEFIKNPNDVHDKDENSLFNTFNIILNYHVIN